MSFRSFVVVIVTLACSLSTSISDAGLKIHFDYSYDTDGFFDDPSRREALETAASLVNRYTDNLTTVEMQVGDTYSEFFQPPNGAQSEFLNAIEIPEDGVIVYVAGNPVVTDRLSSVLNYNGLADGSPEFVNAVASRGQTGALRNPTTDYGPLFSGISFNANPEHVDWHFGVSTDSLDSEQFDFITVAMHALSITLGFVSAPSYLDQSNSLQQFVGSESRAVGSSTNPELLLNDGWWSEETESIWNGDAQMALLRQGIDPGKRTFLTELDLAALRDIGWEEAMPGDANRDRLFDSSDFVSMFKSGKYETEALAGWADGDFDGDSRFGSSDLVIAFLGGQYETPAAAVFVPEPIAHLPPVFLLMAGLIIGRQLRRQISLPGKENQVSCR